MNGTAATPYRAAGRRHQIRPTAADVARTCKRATQAMDRAATLVAQSAARRRTRHHRSRSAGNDIVGTTQVLLSHTVTARRVSMIRHLVTQAASVTGLTGEALLDFTLAVQELMTNAIHHGGGQAHLLLRCDAALLVCSVADNGPGFTEQPATGNPPPTDTEGGRGLFLARQLTRGLHIDSTPAGCTVTVTMDLPHPAVTHQRPPDDRHQPRR